MGLGGGRESDEWEKWKIQRKRKVTDSELIDTLKAICFSLYPSSAWIPSPGVRCIIPRKICFFLNVLLTSYPLVLTLLVPWPKLLITLPLQKHSYRRLLLWWSFPQSFHFSRPSSSWWYNLLAVFCWGGCSTSSLGGADPRTYLTGLLWGRNKIMYAEVLGTVPGT